MLLLLLPLLSPPPLPEGGGREGREGGRGLGFGCFAKQKFCGHFIFAGIIPLSLIAPLLTCPSSLCPCAAAAAAAAAGAALLPFCPSHSHAFSPPLLACSQHHQRRRSGGRINAGRPGLLSCVEGGREGLREGGRKGWEEAVLLLPLLACLRMLMMVMRHSKRKHARPAARLLVNR